MRLFSRIFSRAGVNYGVPSLISRDKWPSASNINERPRAPNDGSREVPSRFISYGRDLGLHNERFPSEIYGRQRVSSSASMPLCSCSAGSLSSLRHSRAAECFHGSFSASLRIRSTFATLYSCRRPLAADLSSRDPSGTSGLCLDSIGMSTSYDIHWQSRNRTRHELISDSQVVSHIWKIVLIFSTMHPQCQLHKTSRTTTSMTNLYRGTQKIQKRLAKPLVARLKWSKKWSKWSTNGVKRKKKKASRIRLSRRNHAWNFYFEFPFNVDTSKTQMSILNNCLGLLKKIISYIYIYIIYIWLTIMKKTT